MLYTFALMIEFTELRIVFMGTPPFAVASLDALVRAGFNIVGVITAPDRPAGRGMKLTESAVKKYAVEKGLQILQPEKLKNPAFLEALKAMQADLQLVVAFRMLPEVVWNMPPMGSVNLHGSLLPQYRGAAPINRAVINGEIETGVTTFKLKHEIDTGDILLQQRFAIGPNETAGQVHDRMMVIGANLLTDTVKGIANKTLQEQPQPTIAAGVKLQHAPKLFTDNCTICWNTTAREIYNLIRGLSPFPGAITQLNGKMLKVFEGKVELATPTVAPGTVVTDNKTFLKIATTDDFIMVTDLQLEGKKRMKVDDFLRGYKV